MSFTLYTYVLSGNCYKIRLFASLLGVDYDAVSIDFHPGGEHRSEAMLALNPAGTLPVLVAGDLILSETAAMLTWMAQRFDAGGTWWPGSEPDMAAQVMEWLGLSGTLTGTVGALRLHAMLNRELDADAARRGATQVLRRLESHLAERVLLGKVWLVGNHPTVADIACFPYAALSPDAGIEHDIYPAIRGWLYAVRSLPGFITMPGIHELHELRDGEREYG